MKLRFFLILPLLLFFVACNPETLEELAKDSTPSEDIPGDPAPTPNPPVVPGFDPKVLWTFEYDSTLPNQNLREDYMDGLAVDSQGNSLMVLTHLEGAQFEASFLKLDSDGQLLENLPMVELAGKRTKDLLLIDRQSFFVLGSEFGGNSLVIRYDLGQTLTTNFQFDVPNAFINQMQITSQGGFALAGYNIGQRRDMFVQMRDALGNVLWTDTHNGDADADDELYSIDVDDLDNVYVTGSEFQGTDRGNIFVRKYDSLGNILFTKRFNSVVSDGVDQGLAILVNKTSEEIYVTGKMAASQWFLTDIWMTKLDTTGDIIWEKGHSGTQGEEDLGNALMFHPEGVVMVGLETIPSHDFQMIEIIFDKETGARKHVHRHNRVAIQRDNGDQFRKVAIGPQGEIFLGGMFDSMFGGLDILLRKIQ